MLIRLIPSAAHPTVLFKLTFENLPGSLLTPSAWSNQLAALACDDLEVPVLVHALDRAVGVQSILKEVTFELAQKKVNCLFVDGEVEEWPMRSSSDLIKRLWSVIDDVNASAAEMERERKREEEETEKERKKLEEQEEAERMRKLQQQQQDEESLLPRTKRGHKKQRSLLMNLVNSLIPLSLNSPRTARSFHTSASLSQSRDTTPSRSVQSFQSERGTQCSSAPSTLSRAVTSLHSRSTSLPPSLLGKEVVIPVPPPPPRLTPRALRRRARSTLVDSFRLHVLPELNQRIRSAGITVDLSSLPTPYITEISAPYYSWVICSMIKSVDVRLGEVVREVRDELDELGKKGFDFDNLPLGILGSTDGAGLSPVSPLSASPFSNEDDRRIAAETDSQATEDSETDTDSSSVHTPTSTSTTFGDPFVAMPTTGAATWAEPAGTVPEQAEDGAVVSPAPEQHHQVKPKLSLSVSQITSPSHLSLPSPAAISPSYAASPSSPIPLPASLASVLAQHAHLNSIHAHLTHLLLVARAKAAAAKADAGARESVLEVRGRRKAWLNHCHGGISSTRVGGTNGNSSGGWVGQIAMAAMATPFRPSGLGRYTWSSEEWECDPLSFKSMSYRNFSAVSAVEAFPMDYYPSPFESEEDSVLVSSGSSHGYGYGVHGYRRRRSSSETSVKLFPVCEEQEQEYDDEEGSEECIRFAVPPGRHTYAHHRYASIVDTDDEDDDDEDDGDVHEDIADALVDIDLDGLARLEDGLAGLEMLEDNDDMEEGAVLRMAMCPHLNLRKKEAVQTAVNPVTTSRSS